MLWRPPAVIIVHQDLVGCLSYPSHIPSTRFPTGTVLVLLTPVWLDRTYIHVLSWLLCETFTFQNHPYMSLYFSSSGSDYPVTLERFGGDGWSWTNSARGGRFTVSWGYQFSYISNWNNGRDLNPRLYGFAIRCIGPLCHRCIVLVLGTGFEPVWIAWKATILGL